MICKEHIPAELIAYPQWVCWRYVQSGTGKKPDKRPLNPRNLHNAGVHWPNTWSTFEHAYTIYRQYGQSGLSGIGFVLTRNDPFVGVDMDNCMSNGELSYHAEIVADHLCSYTEVSPSGAGIRILVACAEFSRNVRQPALEVYSHSRFLTVTGQHLDGTPETVSSVGADTIEALFSEREAAAKAPLQVRTKPLLDAAVDPDLWQCIFAHDRFGEQHLRRYGGDTSLDGGDHSLTVIRLLNCLARWTQCDAARMRTMMLMSPLANEKWLQRRGQVDWLDYQIEDAIRYIRSKS